MCGVTRRISREGKERELLIIIIVRMVAVDSEGNESSGTNRVWSDMWNIREFMDGFCVCW